MGTYPLYFISPLFSQLFPVFLSKSSTYPFSFQTPKKLNFLIYKIIWSDAKRSEQIIFRNFYTAELRRSFVGLCAGSEDFLELHGTNLGRRLGTVNTNASPEKDWYIAFEHFEGLTCTGYG
jgi:hypothetical protein